MRGSCASAEIALYVCRETPEKKDGRAATGAKALAFLTALQTEPDPRSQVDAQEWHLHHAQGKERENRKAREDRVCVMEPGVTTLQLPDTSETNGTCSARFLQWKARC